MANPIQNALSAVKKKVIGVTSDILSAPAQIKAAKAKSLADSQVKTLKLARSYDNAPSQLPNGTITDAGKARSLAQDVKDKLKK